MLRAWNRWGVLLAMIIGATGLAAQPPAPPKQGLVDLLLEYMELRYPGLDTDGDVLYVSVRSQRLLHVQGRSLAGEYVISTSAQGLGGERDSQRTPAGLHYVSERIGADLPAWCILRERVPTGELADSTIAMSGDVITSRILWLSGMEAGLNAGGKVDSHDRWIYIHGTAEEATLGTPSSHGCIRMRNRDIIALFDRVPLGALVVIYDN